MAVSGRVIIGVVALFAASCGETAEELSPPTTIEAEAPAESTTTTSETTTTTTSTTTIAAAAPITTTVPTEPTLVLAPGDEFTIDVDGLGLEPGTPLVVVETGVELSTWAPVGRVGDPSLRLPAIDGAARLDGPQFGEVRFVPLRMGSYELWSPQGSTAITLTVTADGEDVGHEGERPLVDPELAILREDGLASVDFGTPTDVAIPRLIERFGEPVEDAEREGCLGILRVLRFADGIHARFDDTFAEYGFYADERRVDGEDVDDAAVSERPPYTTETGVGLGADNTISPPWIRYSGDYDATVFAPIWFTGDRIGGQLAGGIGFDPTVISIEAGRDISPARSVC